MKAVILAAGYGTRLKELAINKSKPLIEIAGKPIIEHIIKKIEELDNIDEIYIITNNKFYHNFLNWEKHFKNKIAIKILNDGTNSNEEKLGAVGDFAFAVEKEHLNEDILLIAGDNLFKLSLKQMFTFFKEKNSTVIAGIRMSKDYIAKRFGNIISDKNKKIIKFDEKPEKPESDIAATCIYLLKKETLGILSELLESNKKPDNMGEVIRYLLVKTNVYVYVSDEKWLDIGGIEHLEEAKKQFK